jgi:hypothetical protein
MALSASGVLAELFWICGRMAEPILALGCPV